MIRRPTLPALTTIRFFAAMWVVLYHLSADDRASILRTPLIITGYSGVSIFFILSGFILSYNYLGRKIRISAFLLSRGARILPVYWFSLLLAIPLAIHSAHKSGIHLMPLGALAPTLVQAWAPRAALLWNPPGWSLSCEAFFYVVFPMVLVPLTQIAKANRMVCFASLWLAGSIPSLLYALMAPEGVVGPASHFLLLQLVKYNPLCRLPEFLLGVGLGEYYVSGFRINRPRLVAVLCVVATCISTFSVTYLPYPSLHNALLAPLYAVLIMSLASDEMMLSARWLTLLGEASYSLYLTHVIILSTLSAAAKHLEWLSRTYAYISVAIVSSVLISLGTLHFIEIPFRRFVLRRFGSLRSETPLISGAIQIAEQ